MIKISHLETYGWHAAIRGMRNPLNSWKLSDTPADTPLIGENDLNLMKSLVRGGSDHGKFMRQIGMAMDITAPFYWWKEFDTYKVGTVTNSCSTMHTITKREFTRDDFSTDHLLDEALDTLDITIAELNRWREKYLSVCRITGKSNEAKSYWWQIIQLLPSSYNQKRTVTLNYAVLRNMYHARKYHKLDEWRTFCRMIEEDLMYSELITMEQQ